MTILTRYIFKEVTKTFLIMVTAFVMIYVLVDFFERIDNFIEAGSNLWHMIAYIIFKLPLVIDQMTPVAVLMSTIISLGLLARGNEIIALKASGISPARVIRPAIGLAFIISLASFVNSETIVPHTNRRFNDIWKTQVRKEAPDLVYRYESLWYKGDNTVYNIRTFDVPSETLYGVVVTAFDRQFTPTFRVHAERAVWRKGRWLFFDGTVKIRQKDGMYTVETFSERSFPLSETPEDFKKGVKPSDEMGYRELRRYAQKIEKEGYSATTYWVDMHVKLAFPCISLIMGLVGSSLALRKEKGRGVAAGIGIGFAIVALYLVVFQLSKTLGYTGILPPVVAAWASNLIFATLGTWLVLSANR